VPEQRLGTGLFTALRQINYGEGALLLAYAWFCWLMWEITRQYIPWNDDVAFLRIKQEYMGLAYYRQAFFVHVYASIICLPAGFTQFSPGLLKRAPRWHRVSGRIYAFVAVFLAGPSGFVIGLHANGGPTSQLAFCLLAILWVYCTLKGWHTARKGDIKAHRNWMIRSFALALSAITLRAWKVGLVAAFHPRPMDVYRIVAWLGWVLNLLIAEWIIRRRVFINANK